MSKIDHIHLRAVILCMSKMSKTSNTVYIKACQKIDHIHLRAVILCMSKMGKEHTDTFMLITFLIFNQFSIHKKFWKAET